MLNLGGTMTGCPYGDIITLPSRRHLWRRSNVIGVFPNEQSLLRLMGSVLIERNEILQTGKAVFSQESCQALRISDVPKRLSEIADIQHTLRMV